MKTDNIRIQRPRFDIIRVEQNYSGNKSPMLGPVGVSSLEPCIAVQISEAVTCPRDRNTRRSHAC
jgi:hypothetical protein